MHRNNSISCRMMIKMAVILDQIEAKIVNIVEDLSFYNLSLPRALAQACDYVKNVGYVASMPELLRGRVVSPRDSEIWTNWFIALTEENVGKTSFGSSVLVTVHGGGILSIPDRISRAYEEGLTPEYGAKLTGQEFKDIANGKLPDGTQIPIYSFADFQKGVKDLPRQYAVVTDFDTARNTESGRQKIDKLYDNPLVVIRAGGVEAAKAFLDKAKQVYNSKELGNWHPFGGVDVEQPQGSLLCLGVLDYVGLNGGNRLSSFGRFAVVVPEKQGVEKMGATAPSIAESGLEQILAL